MRARNVEYRHRRFFIAEELSFTRAAARLRVAQPHSSREIRRLEANLDVRFNLLPDAVRRFREEWPEVEIVPTEFNSDEQADLLRRAILDTRLLAVIAAQIEHRLVVADARSCPASRRHQWVEIPTASV